MTHLKFILISLFVYLSLSTAQAVPSRFLQQEAHSRTLFFDSWSGASVRGHYDENVGFARFELCGHRDSGSTCELLSEPIRLSELSRYHPRVIAAFRAYRTQLGKDFETSMLSMFNGGRNNPDVKAVGTIITEVQKVSFAHWILLSNENIRKLSPEFTHSKSFDGLVDALSEALNP